MVQLVQVEKAPSLQLHHNIAVMSVSNDYYAISQVVQFVRVEKGPFSQLHHNTAVSGCNKRYNFTSCMACTSLINNY